MCDDPSFGDGLKLLKIGENERERGKRKSRELTPSLECRGSIEIHE